MPKDSLISTEALSYTINDNIYQRNKDPKKLIYQDRYIPVRNNNMISEFQKQKVSLINKKFQLKRKRIVIDSDEEDLLTVKKKAYRHIDSKPYQAWNFHNSVPIKDDFYLNVLDWSTFDVLGFGLDSMVHLWNCGAKRLMQLQTLNIESTVTSVKWSKMNMNLAVGTLNGRVQIWDLKTLTKIRDMNGHMKRVGTLSWNNNIITSGSGDKFIMHKDIRCQQDYVQIFPGHASEVFIIKWSIEGNQLASGSNLNELFIWENRKHNPIYSLRGHTAAIRALSWSPHESNLLVCNLHWSSIMNEIVSTHGWWKNDIYIWKYPSMKKIETLKGHTYRVLYMSHSPNGEDIVTGAGGDDNTLRFWKVFNSPLVRQKGNLESSLKLDGLIR
ncbi:4848_t:CDS:2 [Entrophospora sp. SA101]|nr:4848_t:CDS:2 [Entrophospora sp. SA101]